MKILVTGAAGFIGSSFVDRALTSGWTVVGIDNFSTGRRKFLEIALKNPSFTLLERDLYDPSALTGVLAEDFTSVFHFAANADVKDGLLHPRKDLEQNTIVTWNVLEAMRRANVKNIAFSSTGSVYGEAQKIPTPEDCPFPVQTSLYGASKLAGESLISAYAEGYGMTAKIFRFVSILGERYTHGHIFDFLKQLRKDPSKLRVLGDGKQRKSYLYIQDCIDAILCTFSKTQLRPVEIYNLGTDEYVEVFGSIQVICNELEAVPKIEVAGGNKGWVGDNPFIYLDTTKIKSMGWKANFSIEESVKRTVQYLESNDWLFSEE